MKYTLDVVSQEHFEKLISEHELVFVDFWATWCAPCKQFAEVYESVASEYPQVIFAKVNIESEPLWASDLFGIRSIPHLMVFKQEIAIYSESGSMPKSTLSDLVKQALDVDVSNLHHQIEDEKE